MMFYYLRGTLAHVESGLAVLDVGGVGYSLTISGTTQSALPSRSLSDSPEVKLYTYLAVREDGIELFGFATEHEKETFEMLIGVSGVGPKAALSILSAMTPEKFALAVCSEDRKSISSANGIGPKTAARIVLELKDKLLKETGGNFSALPDVGEAPSAPINRGKLSEALDALMVLGYNRSDAMNILKGLDSENMTVEELIRTALKKSAR